MEKIYSRKRLKISKFKRTTKIKVAFSLIFLGLILFSVQFIISIYPIFEVTSEIILLIGTILAFIIVISPVSFLSI